MEVEEDETLAKKFKALKKAKVPLNMRNKANASQLTKWANDIINKPEIQTLKDIQSYLSKEKASTNKHDIQIVQTILACKQEEKLFMFKANTFKRFINLYLFSDNILTKCLTNDYLNLAMIYSNIVEKMKENMDNFDFSELAKVKIISENFKTTEPTQKGFIQDYDPHFSAICSEAATDITVRNLIESEENKGEFDYADNHYVYYGNQDICIIAADDMDVNAMVDAFNKQKHLALTNGRFEIGEDSVGPTENDVYFINKEITPERFCPCYWIADQRIGFSFLFTFQWEYSRLFEFIDQKGTFNIPRNLCYWDSITECFYFLSVLGLTAQNLSVENKNRLIRWANDYFDLKQMIGYWKRNQLLFQRICNDFLNCFIYDSELSRFINLYKKTQHYIDTYNFLIKQNGYQDVIHFFESITFAQMIRRQLKDDMFALAKKLATVLKKYIEGADPTNIVDEVRSVAQEIYNVLPNNEMKDVAFPFICAKGGLLGKLIKYKDESSDPVLYKAFKNYQKQKKKKEKEQKDINKRSALLMGSDDNKDKFLREYIKLKTKNNKDAEYMVIDELIATLGVLVGTMTAQKRKKFYEEVAKAQKANFTSPIKYKDADFDQAINDHIKRKKLFKELNDKRERRRIKEGRIRGEKKGGGEKKKRKRMIRGGGIKKDDMDIDDDESEEIEDEDDSS